MIEDNKNEMIAALKDEIKRMEIKLRATLTIRDQFAMAALTGALAGRVVGERTEWAKAAYEIADAMMEARK